MSNYTSANHYASALYALARDRGLDANSLLAGAGIARETLNQPRARIPTDKISALVQLIWRELNDEHLGLTASPCKPGIFTMMGKLAVHAPNLEKALYRGIRYYALVSDDISLQLEQSGEEATLRLRLAEPKRDADHLLTELILLSWHRLASWLIGQNIILTRAGFAYPTPAHIDEYRYLFPCSHQFEQADSSFSFNSAYLKHSIVQNYEGLRAFMQGCPTNLFVQHSTDDSLTTRVRKLIEPEIESGFPDLVSVARQLNMTKQTLRLKLKSEGTSYQQIKNLVRRDIAIYHLMQHQDRPIAEIASLVGFSEPGVFIRAFKGWTGVTPGDYRSQDDY